MKFALKLGILSIASVIFFGLLLAYIVQISTTSVLENEIILGSERQAVNSLDKLDRNIHERISDLEVISNDPIIRSRNSSPMELTKRLIEFRNIYGHYASISFFDLNRTRIADTSGVYVGVQHEPAKEFTEVFEKNFSTASEIRESDVLFAPMIYFSSLVRDNQGKAFGILTLRMPITKLNELLSKSIGENEKIDLVDNTGKLIYSNYNSKGILKDNLGNLESFKRANSGETIGNGRNVLLEGKDNFYIFVKESGYIDFKGNGWALLVHIPVNEVFAPAFKLRDNILIVVAITILAVIILIFFFSRYITGNLNKITYATKEIEKGNYKTQITIKSKDEFEDLANVLNKTTLALGKLDENRKQIDKAKTEFLSITSHELRSPMTPMKAQLQMLLQDYFGKLNEKQKESVNLVLRNTERLDKIILDFLEISRIEAARLKFNFVKTDITPHIKSVIDEMKSILPEKHLEVKLDIKKLPNFEVDPDRIMQVLRNIINNALKFSNDHGKILVNVEPQGNYILFSIKDSGIGISKELQSRIFEPFFQAEQTIYRKYGGTGLGLAISKGIVESQHGRIWFESKKDIGTTFYFTIPLEPVREIEPIRLLFSSKEETDAKIKLLFLHYLGPLGEKEFGDMVKKGLTKEALDKYLDNLLKMGILEERKAKEFKEEAADILEESRVQKKEELSAEEKVAELFGKKRDKNKL